MAKTCVLEVRIDIRELAQILQYLVSQGIIPRSKGESMRMVFSWMHSRLSAQGLLQPVETEEEAVEIFTNLGLDTRLRGKLPKALIQQLQVD